MTHLALKPKERASLLAGGFPELVRPEKPEIGQEIPVKSIKVRRGKTVPEVSIRVLSASKVKTGGWRVDYVLKDDRGVYVDQGLGYTRSPTRALDPEAPILDPEVIEEYAAEAMQATALLQAEHWRESKRETTEFKAGQGVEQAKAAERQRRRDG